jgi:hypothetical protein
MEYVQMNRATQGAVYSLACKLIFSSLLEGPGKILKPCKNAHFHCVFPEAD